MYRVEEEYDQSKHSVLVIYKETEEVMVNLGNIDTEEKGKEKIGFTICTLKQIQERLNDQKETEKILE